MSSRVDEFALPLTKIVVYSPSGEYIPKAIDTFTECLPGKPTGEQSEVRSFLASYFEYYLDARLDNAFNECGYTIERTNMTDVIIATWRSLYHPVKFPEPLYIVVNNCLLVMLCAKPVIAEGYSLWAKSRAKAIFQLYRKKLPDDAGQYLLSIEWATLVAGWMQDSQSMRVNFLTHAIILARGATQYRRAYLYSSTMLRYARLTTIVLVRLFLVSAHSGILREPYLAPDVYCWKIAAATLNGYPREVRPYAGILADMDTAALLGGKQLHRLTYIAVKVGARKQHSLEKFKLPELDDKTRVEDLIKKHFPEDHLADQLLPYEDLTAIDLLEAKPIQEMFSDNWDKIKRAFRSIEPIHVIDNAKGLLPPVGIKPTEQQLSQIIQNTKPSVPVRDVMVAPPPPQGPVSGTESEGPQDVATSDLDRIVEKGEESAKSGSEAGEEPPNTSQSADKRKRKRRVPATRALNRTE